jgi:hypothetical protein
MNDLEELLQHGLAQIGERVRPADLERRATETARSIHRRVVLARTTVALAIALVVPATAGLQNRLGGNDQPGIPASTQSSPATPTPSPTSAPAVDYDVLGPDGYGQVKLGMPLAEALATGDLTLIAGSTEECAIARIRPRADEGVTALISKQLGVVAILGPNIKAATPEGIRINASAQEFEHTYPNVRQDLTARVSAPVPGNPQARYVAPLIWVGGDPIGSGAGGEWRVVELNLVSSVEDECLDRFDLTSLPPSGTTNLPAPTNTTVLGPDGYGRLKFGMTLEQALATGEVTQPTEPGGVTGGCVVLSLRAHPDAPVYVVDELGVAAIAAGEGMHTPEGISTDSTVTEFKAAYSGVHEGVNGMSAAAPGNPDANYYTSVNSPGTREIHNLMILLSGNFCFG